MIRATKKTADLRGREVAFQGLRTYRLASRNHDVIKRVRRLRRRTYRDREGRFLVEGPNLLNEAASSGANIRELLYLPDRSFEADLIRGRLTEKPQCFEINAELLGWISDVVTSQGIVGVVDLLDRSYEDVVTGGLSMAIVADQVRDPGNLGALVRIADATALDTFMVTAGSVDPYNSKVVRSAAGSHFHLPIVRNVDMLEVTSELRASGVRVLGLDSHSGSDYLGIDYTGPVVFVVGNEAFGFSEADRAAMDGTVRIKMPGRAESLNVAAAAAVVLFEALRQRKAV